MIEEQRLAGMRVAQLTEKELRTLGRLLNVQGYEHLPLTKLKVKVKRKQRTITQSYGLRKPAP